MLAMIVNYGIHLVSGLALLGAFYLLYTWVTPWDELSLMRQGNLGAAFSLSGALLGFTLTIASSIAHNDSLPAFAAWAIGAMLVQMLAYLLCTRAIGRAQEAIERGNVAVGAFMGAVSLALGAINAACLT